MIPKYARLEFYVNGDLFRTFNTGYHLDCKKRIQTEIERWKRYAHKVLKDGDSWEIYVYYRSEMRLHRIPGKKVYNQNVDKQLNKKITKLAHELGI